MKKIMLALCVLVMGGCMQNHGKRTMEDVENSILEYMEAKYDEAFEITEIGKQFILGATVSAKVVAKNDEYRNVSYVTWDLKDGKEVIVDDYMCFLYKKKFNDYIDKKMQQVFAEYDYVNYSILADVEGMEKYDASLSFPEIGESYDISYSVAILLDEPAVDNLEDVKEKMMKFYKVLEEELTKEMKTSIHLEVCISDVFDENKQLVEEMKNHFDLINSPQKRLTYNNKKENILEEYFLTTSDLEKGVHE